MKKYLVKNLEKVENLLKTQNIYHITDCHWSLFEKDSFESGKVDDLRNNWIFSPRGLLNSLDKFSSLYERIIEFALNKDFPNSFRHRIHIINTLYNCNFRTNNPVHITSINKNSSLNVLIDFEKNKFDGIQIAIHPGYTRAQGSVFLRENLKNVLFYTHKDDNISVTDSKNVKKIETIEELIECYYPTEKTDSNFQLFFCFSDSHGNFKNQGWNDISVLKLYELYYWDGQKKIDLNASSNYLNDTFISSNNFFKILFNNNINVYSNNIKSVQKFFEKNRVDLYSLTLNNFNDGYAKIGRFLKIMMPYSINVDKKYDEKSNSVLNSLVYNYKNNLNNNEIDLIKDFSKIMKYHFNQKNFSIKENYIEYNDTNFENLVKLNQYRGYAIWTNPSLFSDFLFDRDILEILFLINSDISIAINEERNLAIINCEHEYWKTGKNYIERVINKGFYDKRKDTVSNSL